MKILNNVTLKQFFLLLAMVLFLTPLSAQKVRNESGIINSKKFAGFSIVINENHGKVTEFWIDELKEIGKIRRKRDFYEIEGLNLEDEYNPEAIFYSRVTEKDSTSSSVWIALDPETLISGESGVENVNLALKNYVSSIPLAFEIHSIEKQIEETNRAADFTTRQQEKLVTEKKNLEYQLEESKAERDRMILTLQNLELEILALSQKVLDNDAQTKQVQVDLEKILKMKDQYKQKLLKLKE